MNIIHTIKDAANRFQHEAGYQPTHLYLGTASYRLWRDHEEVAFGLRYSEPSPTGLIEFAGLKVLQVLDDPEHLRVS